jgi:hypothetical protein
MKLLIDRYSPEEKQTIGCLYLLGTNDSVISKWDSLELPWLDNKGRVSCIPTGNYKARKHNSPKFGSSLWLQDVPNRSEILIHKGNYYSDILGCILIGRFLRDINNDGLIDVVDSQNAVKELLSYLKNIDFIMIQIR